MSNPTIVRILFSCDWWDEAHYTGKHGHLGWDPITPAYRRDKGMELTEQTQISLLRYCNHRRNNLIQWISQTTRHTCAVWPQNREFPELGNSFWQHSCRHHKTYASHNRWKSLNSSKQYEPDNWGRSRPINQSKITDKKTLDHSCLLLWRERSSI